MTIKLTPILCVFAFTFSCMTFFSSCLFWSTNSKTDDTFLVVGTESGFAPYETIDSQGELVGFDVDLINIIAEKMGKKLVINDMGFDGLMISLKQAKVDLIIAGLSITPERQKEIDMIHYYGEPLASFPLLFWEKIPADVAVIEDLAKLPNRTVAVQAGTVHEQFVSQYDFIDIKHLDKISELIMEIKYGKSIACALEPLVVAPLLAQHPELKVMSIPVSDQFKDFGNGIGVKKGNKAMFDQVTAIVNELKHDGTIDRLALKWFKKGNSNDK